jgi:hypothetical protein
MTIVLGFLTAVGIIIAVDMIIDKLGRISDSLRRLFKGEDE